MKRFVIKKIIVISDNIKSSLEVSFEKGLNIIIGENKYGKSSIIKSIFYTLGCETQMDKSWKKLIDTYILFFLYGFKQYCIIRQADIYKIYEVNENVYKILCNANNYTEFSNYLVKEILGISFELVTKQSKEVCFIPPLLFRYQYIDQEFGWSSLGDGFQNMKYIKNWQDSSIKFVIGYQGEEYYKIKKDKDIIDNDIKELTEKYNHYDELISSISNEKMFDDDIKNNQTYIEDVRNKAENMIKEITNNERIRIEMKQNISQIKNELYMNEIELQFIKKSIKELDEDYKFSATLNEKIECPFCGHIYNNKIEDRLEIVKDIQRGKELIREYRNDNDYLQKKLDEYIFEEKESSRKIAKLKVGLKTLNSSIDFSENYKAQGRKEIIDRSKLECESLHNQIDKRVILRGKYINKIKENESRKRHKEIQDEFKSFYTKVLEKLNIGTSLIKLKNFKQVLENTGSEKPRIILAYYIALYLYNLERGENIFNFIIIDTPNQQGQDSKNLKNIDSIMEYLLDARGQAIIGTERVTGYEEKANKVIELKHYKRCLKVESYDEHKQLVSFITGV